MKLTPVEREQFKRELPIAIVMFIIVAAILAYVMAIVPAVAVQS